MFLETKMAIMDKLRGRQTNGEPEPTSNVTNVNGDIETQGAPEITSDSKVGGANFADYQTKEELPTEDAQPGVQKIEAVTLAWTKKSLAALLCLYVFPDNLRPSRSLRGQCC